jgi:hypothetical protein
VPLSETSPVTGARHPGSTCVWYVTSGLGTKVTNIGFNVRTEFNPSNQPSVRVFPYALNDHRDNLFDPRIAQTVQDICQEISRTGIHVSVDGKDLTVAPRTIYGETIVLDFHGRKPIEWLRPGDSRAQLQEVSFSVR